MSRPVRLVLFWSLVTLYVIASFWWLVVVPPRPHDLLRAVPGHASAVLVMDDLARDWSQTSRHPLIMMLAGSLGMDADTWAEFQDDPGVRAFIQLAGRHSCLLARVPFLDQRYRETTVVASWIGGQSQRLRWSHRHLRIPDLSYVGVIGSWPVWSWRSASDDMEYLFALVEGILIATDGDRHAMASILETYDGNFPSLRQRADIGPWTDRLMHGSWPVRGLMRTINQQREMTYWFAGLDLRQPDQLSGSIFTKAPATLQGLPASLNLAGIDGIWRDAPLAAAAFQLHAVNRALDDYSQFAADVLRDVLSVSRAESAALGLFGGDFSGRFKAIKIPTLMAGLHRAGGFDLDTLLPALVDRWNAEYQLGLVPVRFSAGDFTVYRLEGVTGGLYGSLSASEQVAVVAAGDWLVVSSNAGALEKLILDDEDAGGTTEPAWVRHINDVAGEGGVGYLGFDLADGAEAFKLAISAYSLKLVFEDANGTRAQRKRLNEMKAWLDTLAKMNRLHVSARVTDGLVAMDVQAGP